jgi:hypothetical protein
LPAVAANRVKLNIKICLQFLVTNCIYHLFNVKIQHILH